MTDVDDPAGPSPDGRDGTRGPHAPPERGFSLHLPPSATSIAVARSVVRRTVGFRDDDAAGRFLTALGEIVVNAIAEHQLRDDPSEVTVTAELAGSAHVTVVNAIDPDATRGLPFATTGDAERLGDGLSVAFALVPALSVRLELTRIRVTLPLRGFLRP